MSALSETISRWRCPVAAMVVASAICLMALPASALPSFARQTGQDCAACHTGFPELTPYGRLFKANGYTFPSQSDKVFGNSDLPPLSAMIVASYTHTGTAQPGGAAPHIAGNNNPMIQQAAIYYGGAIAPNLGALFQVNFDNAARQISWDDLDLRYSRVGSLFGSEAVYGVSFNNDPTVTDLWNSTPVWGYPYMASSIVPTPAGTLVEGTLGSQVIGLNPFIYWDRLVYADVGVYRTFSPWADKALGVDPAFSSIKGATLYWRLAIEPKWGRNAWEFGTFGLAATLNPGRMTGSGTDHTTDIGFDTQYQFLGARDSVTLKGSYITENQNLTASQVLGNTSNSHDHLRSLHADISYYYQGTYGGTVQYFAIDGSGDPTAYGGTYSSPNSKGVTFEFDYIPYAQGGPAFWPWMNAKFGLQYTLYTQFNGGSVNYDGAGRSAANNNTLYLYSMIAF